MRRSLALPRDLERLLLYVDPVHGIVLRREGVVFTGALQSRRWATARAHCRLTQLE